MLLPLALNVALLLMLSSLLLLTLALQSRLQAAVQQQRRHTEDKLMNAAQRLAGQLQSTCPELLVVPHGEWGVAGACGGIAQGEGVRVVSYAPGGGQEQGTGELVLELSDRDPAPRAAFALHWRLEPPQLVGIEERGLRGVDP